MYQYIYLFCGSGTFSYKISNFRNNQTMWMLSFQGLLQQFIVCNYRTPSHALFLKYFQILYIFAQFFKHFALFQHFFTHFLENLTHARNFQNRNCLYFLVNQNLNRQNLFWVTWSTTHIILKQQKNQWLNKPENTISCVP